MDKMSSISDVTLSPMGPLALKRVYKALKKNVNSTTEQIKEAKAAYLAAKSMKVSKISKKRKRNDGTATSYNSTLKNHISVSGSDLQPYESFDATPFNDTIKAVLTTSYTAPTPVQAQAWPVILSGYDLVSVAKTGSGKTCGFLVPLMHALASRTEKSSSPSTTTNATTTDTMTTTTMTTTSTNLPSPKGLVLAPVRELAIQINMEALRFAKPLGLRCCCLYGGAPKHNQINSLRGGANAFPHLIVATPGRLLDLCKSNGNSNSIKGKAGPAMTISNVEYFVLDEADRMLDLGTFFSQEPLCLLLLLSGVINDSSDFPSILCHFLRFCLLHSRFFNTIK